MTFVSIITIALTLFFFGCIIIGFVNIKKWLSNAESQASLVIYIDDDVYKNENNCHTLVDKISSLPWIDSLTLVGKEEAWKRFERLYGSEMLDAVDENPLPASIDVIVKQNVLQSGDFETLKKELELIPGVDGINFSREWLMQLKKFRTFFFWFVMIIVPVLILALHFMIANTIKLTIYARKDLVKNMQFVGATDFYIKTPFILEGMLQGIIGGLFGIAGLSFMKLFLVRFFPFVGDWRLSLTIFFIGVFFGWLGSTSAVRRFLV